MPGDKNAVDVHVIHSMKGGCGKSTCALFKALQIAQEQGIEDKKAHVLLLDADFKGSAMTEILFHRKKLSEETEGSLEEREQVQKFNELEKKFREKMTQGTGMRHKLAIPENFEQYITISDYLKDNSRYSINDIICRSCSYESTEKDQAKGGAEENEADLVPEQTDAINGYLDFILSSANSESKDWFRHTHGKIAAGVYSYRMDVLLRNLLNRGRVIEGRPGDYWDIVIDMPPGYDEYSDILLELLRKIAAENTVVRLHYYGVTTEDIGHKILTQGSIKKAICENTRYKPFSSVNLILSDASHTDFLKFADKEKEFYRSWLEGGSSPEGKVYANTYSESYHRFCREGTMGEFEQNIKEVLREI